MDLGASEEERQLDEWPKMSDGTDWDGTSLMTFLSRGESPFRGLWDVMSLIREVEQILQARVVDIPSVSFGAHHYVGVSD